jgi:dUTP pyrophosphatase
LRDQKELLIETKEFMPEYGTKQSSGFDLKAFTPNEDIRIGIGEAVTVPSGIKMGIYEGYEVQLRSRSGLTKKHGLIIAQGTATIDEDYVGEVGIILRNEGDKPFYVTHGMRVCQGVYAPTTEAVFKKVDSLNKETERGSGAYGSTGSH